MKNENINMLEKWCDELEKNLKKVKKSNHWHIWSSENSKDTRFSICSTNFPRDEKFYPKWNNSKREESHQCIGDVLGVSRKESLAKATHIVLTDPKTMHQMVKLIRSIIDDYNEMVNLYGK